MATKVTLRRKNISKGRQSLYLDYYPPIPHPTIKGKMRRKEYLKIYIYQKPKNSLQKVHNDNVLRIAEFKRIERQNTLHKQDVYSDFEIKELKRKELGKLSFTSYFNDLAKKKTGTTSDNWYSSLKHFRRYKSHDVLFEELDIRLIEGFKEYLLNASSNKDGRKTISRNTASAYFNKFKATLKQAFRDGLLEHDLGSRVRSIPEEEVLKNTLTIEELRHIASLDFQENPLTKKITLFSCMTGMPFQEIKNLTWGEVEKSETFGIRVRTKRQKTSKNYEIYISNAAYELLGEPKADGNLVFEGLTNEHRYRFFQILLAKAGITKKLTFHDLRHTYATLQIELGTDIYTLNSQLNHGSLSHTQRYGKPSIIKKREAANKIKLD